eukprot:gb/GECH01013987.1/.p1 GENE.gb/GECH01013987.1/~~gb/GECH01013987.1/.p1  ORF type:complete len:330 (+),score=57.66 gb/GECH01013987.1/:1-990(+)
MFNKENQTYSQPLHLELDKNFPSLIACASAKIQNSLRKLKEINLGRNIITYIIENEPAKNFSHQIRTFTENNLVSKLYHHQKRFCYGVEQLIQQHIGLSNSSYPCDANLMSFISDLRKDYFHFINVRKALDVTMYEHEGDNDISLSKKNFNHQPDLFNARLLQEQQQYQQQLIQQQEQYYLFNNSQEKNNEKNFNTLNDITSTESSSPSSVPSSPCSDTTYNTCSNNGYGSDVSSPSISSLASPSNSLGRSSTSFQSIHVTSPNSNINFDDQVVGFVCNKFCRIPSNQAYLRKDNPSKKRKKRKYDDFCYQLRFKSNKSPISLQCKKLK